MWQKTEIKFSKLDTFSHIIQLTKHLGNINYYNLGSRYVMEKKFKLCGNSRTNCAGKNVDCAVKCAGLRKKCLTLKNDFAHISAENQPFYEVLVRVQAFDFFLMRLCFKMFVDLEFPCVIYHNITGGAK